MEILDALSVVAQYAGLPGLLILYLIVTRQRNQDKSDSGEKESAMEVKYNNLKSELDSLKQDRKEESNKIDSRFRDLENKVDSNHKELNNKLDRMNENTTSALMSIKDILADMKTDVAVLSDRKHREDIKK